MRELQIPPTAAGHPPLCEACDAPFSAEDLEDGFTIEAACCGRIGLCYECRQYMNHDCDRQKPHH